MLTKILIANRGEIAVRIMRACREMEIHTVAVYSDADRKALHVRLADEAVSIGPPASAESYLRADRLIDAARSTFAEAIHPGYGFLSENPEFALECEGAGLRFVGPGHEAMRLMGSKTAARRLVAAAGLPVVPGVERNLDSLEEVEHVAARFGYPVMLKAAGGGGGKGMRIVGSAEELESAFRTARSEAQNAFGDSAVYVEKYLDRPRHIEVQILGDVHGHLIHLGERECSLQRRHQKVMEEAPSPYVDDALRSRMGRTAVEIGKLAGYTNAGTVEFLVDREGQFYFLEMNARLQVEHPVTEQVTGIDLVKAQIRVAAGEPLPWRQEDVVRRGHSLECRIYAEDPGNNFFPSPGLIRRLRAPAGPGVRDDSGVFEGWTVPIEYDPLLSKLVTWGNCREEALARMARALDEYEIEGIKTNIPFFRRVVRSPDLIAGRLDTSFIDRLLADDCEAQDRPSADDLEAATLAAALEASRQSSRPMASESASAWKRAGRAALLGGP